MGTTLIEELEDDATTMQLLACQAMEMDSPQDAADYRSRAARLRARAEHVRALPREIVAVVFRATGCGIVALAEINRAVLAP